MLNNEIRIIGGEWRGRKLTFPNLPGLRPTPDRVRETLFNWLSFSIAGANCLDLFAGSGALGLESLSRGAEQVTFVDSQYVVIQHIRSICENLGATNAHFVHGTVPSCTLDAIKTYDIVFIDPPYGTGLVNQSITWLEHHHYLSPSATIYIERSLEDEPLNLPHNWQVARDKQAGQVNYLLIERS